ncbi:MAG: pilus assembly protein PilM [Pseudomonadales bacterium]|jgi:type IV pilus assembly protein PilM|nr:pilus assembly protein PilM [Pseudomonadales bacterium]
MWNFSGKFAGKFVGKLAGKLAGKRAAAFGIDIGSSTVKLLQLRRHGRAYRVEFCAVRPVPAGAVAEKRIMDAAAVGTALQDPAPARPGIARRAVVAVPSSAVITRQLEFAAALGAAELEVQVATEAERHLPFALSEVALDFVRLAAPPAAATPATVLLAACRKEHVESRVAALAQGGYAAAVVEIETQAVERAFALLGDSAGVVALADLGGGGFTLYVLHDGAVIYAREQSLAGARLGAMEAKSLLPELLAHEQLTQLRRALQVFYSSSAYPAVDRLVLAGGGAVHPGLTALAEDLLQMPATLANPLAAMGGGPGVDTAQLAREGPALFLATGLALRGLRDA